MQMILMADYEIQCVENGVECLQSIEERIPDLLLLDFAMPEMDGVEVCKNIRSNKKTKGLPIVMVSGYGSKEHIQNGYQAGIDKYVTKPFTRGQLLTVVEEYLKS